MIRVGIPLSLEYQSMHEKECETYRCKVVDYTHNQIFVDYPLNEKTQRTTFLTKGTKLNVTFIGEDKAVYTFLSEVIGRTIQDIPVIQLTYPGDDELEAVQRRNFFRVPATLEVHVAHQKNQQEILKTLTSDISAGGMAVSFQKRGHFQVGDLVAISIEFPVENKKELIELQGEVIRVTEPIPNKVGKLSLQFINLDKKVKEKLVRYTLKRQLELRRKGLV
ncbi:glycosyltransferase [Priestia megaterium]|nr:glycosyltransferase [Priestia megaterium]